MESKYNTLIYIGLGFLFFILGAIFLPCLQPESAVGSKKSESMAEHIKKVHGFVISDRMDEQAHLIALPKGGDVTVRLTERGKAVLDNNDQQALGLSGQREIFMSVDEYGLFLNKLHALLQLKGMSANGSGESSIAPTN